MEEKNYNIIIKDDWECTFTTHVYATYNVHCTLYNVIVQCMYMLDWLSWDPAKTGIWFLLVGERWPLFLNQGDKYNLIFLLSRQIEWLAPGCMVSSDPANSLWFRSYRRKEFTCVWMQIENSIFFLMLKN